MLSLKRLRRMPLLSSRQWLRRVAFWIGALLVGAAAIVFASMADRAGQFFLWMIDNRPWLPFILAPIGLGVSCYLTRTAFRGAQGSGIPQVIAALHMHEPERIDAVLSMRIAVGKILLTLVGLACGASIGREGPTVQVGATIMHALGRVLRLPRQDVYRAMVLAGGAAGVAAAFNTPLAGVVFGIEELSHSFEVRSFGKVLTAVIISGIATMAMVGNYTYFGTASAELDFGIGWIAVLACGICGGLAGGAFSSILLAFARGLPGRLGREVRDRPVLFAGVCGLSLAIFGFLSEGSSYGTGYAQARSLVAGQSSLPETFFVLKFLASVVSYVSGIPGGIFAPSLAVGAGLGHAIGQVLTGAPAGALVLLGMVGYFSGVVQAPITATVIVMEMTDDQRVTVPLMATAVLAFGVSQLVCRRPLYATLARRFVTDTTPAAEPSQSIG